MNHQIIQEKIALCKPITLAGINELQVDLQNRIDSKYLIHIEDFINLMDYIRNDYLVLEIEGKRVQRYETLYFDTEDYQFYNMHHNKKGTRLKVRIRKYIENGLIFLEIKEKNNKSVTAKRRVALPYFPQNLMELKNVIEAAGIDIMEEELQPQLWTFFQRMTFVNPIHKERMTIDVDLILKNSENELLCENLVIVELKREKNQHDSPIIQWMKNHQVKEDGFSKYTIGTALINSEVKKNNFKLKLHELKHHFVFDFQQ
ncbi:MAG: polyphosphate polymerase domain-containing protein [Bacteroidia bacterium]|nr:polyphosphate polymerase domain-containing protein [Bacteroidia bacterium]